MIPVGVIILAIVAVIAGLILKKTPFGWHVQAIGGNEKASKLSGIKVDRVKSGFMLFRTVLSYCRYYRNFPACFRNSENR